MSLSQCCLHRLTPPKVLHRDLKCANLLVASDRTAGGASDVGDVRICDFSESRVLSTKAPMTACGTAFWIAPEVFKGIGYTEKGAPWSRGISCHTTS